MRVTARINIDLAQATNYLILGNWSNAVSYKLSDAGIPVVKVPDGTSLGYSVYSLEVDEATVGLSPSASGNTEWKLVESAEFIYMQQAYIERLQAAIVTAEKIEALMIRTKNLEVLMGAKLAKWDVDEDGLYTEGDGKMVVKRALNRFLELNANPYDAFLKIRNDYYSCLILDTFGSVNPALNITSNGGSGIAVKSSGGHRFWQRIGEVWTSPGVLGSGQFLWGSNVITAEKVWAVESVSFYTTNRSGNNFRLQHNLGHLDYVLTPLAVGSSGHIRVLNRTENYVDMEVISFGTSQQFFLTLVGRNKVPPP